MIPKKIHYCWFGRNSKPKLAEKCIKSWKKFCPDYEIVEWNEDNYDYLKSDFMREAYEAKKWGFVPDYARLDIIYNYGGLYLDTDVEIVKPMDPLLEYKGFMGFESNDYLALGLGFGAEAGNEIIKTLRNSYESRHFIMHDGSLDQTPSPRNDSKVLKDMGIELNGNMQEKDGFIFLPPEYLNPISFGDTTIRENTYSIHWFAASWCDEEEKKKQEASIRQIKMNHYLQMPNRVGRRILGDEKYEQLRKLLKGR